MKVCGKCKQEKTLSEFNKNKGTKDGYHGDCRSCKKQYQADWYQRHKDEHRARTKTRNKRVVAELREFVKQVKDVPCLDCGGRFPSFVMDFDHLPEYDKVGHVARLVNAGKSLQKIKDEIAKCEIVCANCHRIRTWVRSSEAELPVLSGKVEIS